MQNLSQIYAKEPEGIIKAKHYFVASAAKTCSALNAFSLRPICACIFTYN